jgi:hypothetical protein
VQVTNVAPNGNLPPLAGEHDELTGIVPPEIVGAAYVIVTAFPSGDESDWLAGQLIPKDDGCDGELQLEKAIEIKTSPAATKTRRPRRQFFEELNRTSCSSCLRGSFKGNSHLAP